MRRTRLDAYLRHFTSPAFVVPGVVAILVGGYLGWVSL